MPNSAQETKIYHNGDAYVKRHYKKVIEALNFIADLKVAGERSFLKYITALQKLLNWLEQAATQRELPVKLKFAVATLQMRINSLVDPGLIEQSELSINTNDLKLLAYIIRNIVKNLLQDALCGFTTTVHQIFANAVNNAQGNGNYVVINNNAVQQFSTQVFNIVTDSLNNPEPSVPEFEPNLFKDDVESLINATPNLTNDVVNQICEEIYDCIQLFSGSLRNMVDRLTWLYIETSGFSYDDSISKLFGDKCKFFGSVWDEDEKNTDYVFKNKNSFFPPQKQQQQSPTNPEKDLPDAPDWKYMWKEEQHSEKVDKAMDLDGIEKYVY